MTDTETRSERTLAFIAEVLEVCERHGLAISHEDGQGAFRIVPLDDWHRKWFAVAVEDLDVPGLSVTRLSATCWRIVPPRLSIPASRSFRCLRSNVWPVTRRCHPASPF